MNQTHLKNLAQKRLEDAAALKSMGRWAAMYYLTGYVVECNLKVCILKYLGESEAVFGDDAYLKKLAGCWTHDLDTLLKLAGLEKDFGVAREANSALERFWIETKDWKETSRYQEKSEAEAERLYEAVSHETDGVFQWIRSRW